MYGANENKQQYQVQHESETRGKRKNVSYLIDIIILQYPTGVIPRHKRITEYSLIV